MDEPTPQDAPQDAPQDGDHVTGLLDGEAVLAVVRHCGEVDDKGHAGHLHTKNTMFCLGTPGVAFRDPGWTTGLPSSVPVPVLNADGTTHMGDTLGVGVNGHYYVDTFYVDSYTDESAANDQRWKARGQQTNGPFEQYADAQRYVQQHRTEATHYTVRKISVRSDLVHWFRPEPLPQEIVPKG